MTSEQPIWQSAVHGTHNGKKALGRLFVQGEDVYYFPELPQSKGASPWWPLSTGSVGVLFFVLGVLPHETDPNYIHNFSTYSMDMDLFGGNLIIGALLIVLAISHYIRQTLVAKRATRVLLEDDEFMGMNLDDRFSVSPDASRFTLADIVRIKGKRTVVIRTKLDENFRFKSISNDPTMAARLRGEGHSLPREERTSDAAQRNAASGLSQKH